MKPVPDSEGRLTLHRPRGWPTGKSIVRAEFLPAPAGYLLLPQTAEAGRELSAEPLIGSRGRLAAPPPPPPPPPCSEGSARSWSPLALEVPEAAGPRPGQRARARARARRA